MKEKVTFRVICGFFLGLRDLLGTFNCFTFTYRVSFLTGTPLKFTYRVSFLTGTPLKVLSVRLHSKSHQKCSKCQNLRTEENLFLGESQLKKDTLYHSSKKT